MVWYWEGMIWYDVIWYQMRMEVRWDWFCLWYLFGIVFFVFINWCDSLQCCHTKWYPIIIYDKKRKMWHHFSVIGCQCRQNDALFFKCQSCRRTLQLLTVYSSVPSACVHGSASLICMYVCQCMYVSVYVCECMCQCMYVSVNIYIVCMCMCVCQCMYVWVWVYVCISVRMYVLYVCMCQGMYVWVYVCIGVCMNVCMYECMYVC